MIWCSEACFLAVLIVNVGVLRFAYLCLFCIPLPSQMIGKVPLNVDASSIDLMSISGHKLYGPKGAIIKWEHSAR